MSEPQVSIVIPCYNHGKYVQEALDSLVGCKLTYEVIVVDDGSPDPETIAVLDALMQLPELTVIRQPNGGPGKARNTGIEKARAPFVVPLDADNRMVLSGLYAAYDEIQKDDTIAVVYGDAELFEQQSGTWVNQPLDLKAMVMSNQIDNCVLLRRAAWQNVGGYPPDKAYQSHEDWLFWLRLLENGWQFRYIHHTFFEYRILQTSLLRTEGKEKRKVTRIYTYAYGSQSRIIQKLVADRVMSRSEANDLLGNVESQLAYYQLLYGNFAEGLGNWWRSVKHAPGMIGTNLRIAIVCPIKRVASDLFKVNLSLARQA